jgi:hypothetical protein
VSGCEPPEKYERWLAEAGFVHIRRLGATDFWTSPSTRGMNFVATKPLDSAAAATAIGVADAWRGKLAA